MWCKTFCFSFSSWLTITLWCYFILFSRGTENYWPWREQFEALIKSLSDSIVDLYGDFASSVQFDEPEEGLAPVDVDGNHNFVWKILAIQGFCLAEMTRDILILYQQHFTHPHKCIHWNNCKKILRSERKMSLSPSWEILENHSLKIWKDSPSTLTSHENLALLVDNDTVNLKTCKISR